MKTTITYILIGAAILLACYILANLVLKSQGFDYLPGFEITKRHKADMENRNSASRRKAVSQRIQLKARHAIAEFKEHVDSNASIDLSRSKGNVYRGYSHDEWAFETAEWTSKYHGVIYRQYVQHWPDKPRNAKRNVRSFQNEFGICPLIDGTRVYVTDLTIYKSKPVFKVVFKEGECKSVTGYVETIFVRTDL